MRNGRFTQFQDGKCDVLVCTDIASRGLDTVRVSIVVSNAEADSQIVCLEVALEQGMSLSSQTGGFSSLMLAICFVYTLYSLCRRFNDIYSKLCYPKLDVFSSLTSCCQDRTQCFSSYTHAIKLRKLPFPLDFVRVINDCYECDVSMYTD